MVCPVRSPAALPSVIMARANQKRPDVHWLSSSQPSHALPKLPTTLRRRCTVIPQRLTISFSYLFCVCVCVCVCWYPPSSPSRPCARSILAPDLETLCAIIRRNESTRQTIQSEPSAIEGSSFRSSNKFCVSFFFKFISCAVWFIVRLNPGRLSLHTKT